MTQAMTTTTSKLSAETMSAIVVRGDVSGLNQAQLTEYYVALCERVGLDPATQPFKLMTLNGKKMFYADKGAGDQLRKLHRVSIRIVSRETVGEVYVVTACATMPDGRTDESQGAVAIGGLKSDNLANAVMKAETKAKRRVTLSIIGLGMLDKSELDTIPRDRLEQLPPEQQARPVVVEAKPAAPKSLPELPDEVVSVPAELVAGLKTLSGLEGVPMTELGDDDLALVISTCRDNRPKVKTPLAKSWLLALEARATVLLDERNTDEAA